VPRSSHRRGLARPKRRGHKDKGYYNGWGKGGPIPTALAKCYTEVIERSGSTFRGRGRIAGLRASVSASRGLQLARNSWLQAGLPTRPLPTVDRHWRLPPSRLSTSSAARIAAGCTTSLIVDQKKSQEVNVK